MEDLVLCAVWVLSLDERVVALENVVTGVATLLLDIIWWIKTG